MLRSRARAGRLSARVLLLHRLMLTWRGCVRVAYACGGLAAWYVVACSAYAALAYAASMDWHDAEGRAPRSLGAQLLWKWYESARLSCVHAPNPSLVTTK